MDPVWYYARGDTEKGPLSTAQMKALAAAGKVRPDDLVWKEGMETWSPARELAELYPADSRNGGAAAAGRSIERKADTASSVAAARYPAAASGTRPWGRVSLLAGLLVVLVARGCNEMGESRVRRLVAQAELAQRLLVQPIQEQRQMLLDEQQRLQDSANGRNAAQQRLNQIAQELSQLDVAQQETIRAHQPQLDAVREAALGEARQQASASYWRDAAFWCGTLILVAGLLAISGQSEGPDRWLCLAMLAAILWGVYS